MTDKVEGQPLHVDILLVTVTDVEAQAVITAFPAAKLCHLGDQAYHDLGILAGARIFMVQSEMGSGGQSGSILTIQDAIDVLHPSAIIMVGIAFGINQKKRQMGDILVSRQLLPYDLQRVGTDSSGKVVVTLRADRPSASPRMLSIFRGAANYWQEPPKVQFGPILSGDKLVDNQQYRDQMVELSPEAIGGEMEGAGLYAAAQRKKVDWILVKGICDWADGQKNQQDEGQRQKDAAENAVRFITYVISKGGFAGQNVQTTAPFAPHCQSSLNEETQTGKDTNRRKQEDALTGAISPSDLLQEKIRAGKFDVFLCYNSVDREAVKNVGNNLKAQGILPWMDIWELRPGFPWQRAVEQQIRTSKSAAVFVGKNELGPWHRTEMEALLQQFQKRNCPIIPVLLPDATREQDLPVFLDGMSWVDFRRQDLDPLEELIWGITGERREP
ncbi:MAG: TIR domain-containing protein [Ktedonobacteraceae bacterium]|nr:TIR domain-containing protein [Ktedonobacteraceae bacterium]